MASKKEENEEIIENESEGSQMHEDWRPDYFPTSAKPVFKKVGFLLIGILILCLFLGYCSTEDSSDKTDSKTNHAVTTDENEENEAEIFE